MRYRLKEDHPVAKAMREIEATMDRHGITLRQSPIGSLEIVHERRVYTMRDLDDGSQCHALPWPFESVITFDVD